MPGSREVDQGDFSLCDIEAANRAGRILCLEIDLNPDAGQRLSDADFFRLVQEAKECGARKIKILVKDGKAGPVAAGIEKSSARAGLDFALVGISDGCPGQDRSWKNCLKYKYSCLLSSWGEVFLCSGLPIVLGDVRRATLKEIISSSEVIEDLRRHTQKIKGPCRECREFAGCCGCRGRAFSFSGDYLASDPGCPDNQAKRSAIVCLPVPAQKLIPHRGPMLLVDDLDKVADRLVEASVLVRPDSPFVDDQGELDEAIYMELMAQAAATFNGFGQLGLSGGAQEGFLLGAKALVVHAKARGNDKLRITAFKHGRFENFGILRCKVYRDQEVLAEGEIKIWHK